mgnify:FL=1
MPIFNFYRFENKQVDNEPSFLLQKRRQRLDLIRGNTNLPENVLEVSLLPSNAISYLS